MQGLTDPPRQDLTDAQVLSLLTGDSVAFGVGMELLDDSNNLVEDMSVDLLPGGSINRNNFAAVHGTISGLQITRELAWGKDRVRLYVTLHNDDIGARFDVGVYVLTTPTSVLGVTPQVWDVDGYDVLQLLQRTGAGDTYVIETSNTYLSAVRQIVDDSGTGLTVRLDGTGQATALPAPRVWNAISDGPSWLRMINDLLGAIGYYQLWAEPDGSLRSAPYADPADRANELTLDPSNWTTDIDDPVRSVTKDVWNAPNHWVFVLANPTGDNSPPTEGHGLYTVDNVSDGPSSQDSIGLVAKPLQTLDAPDHDSLVAQADRIVAQDRAVVPVFNRNVDPYPLMWHRDIITVKDGGIVAKLEAVSWTLNLDGERGALVLGGGVQPTVDAVSQQARASVTNPNLSYANPGALRVLVDGSTIDCPANSLLDSEGWAAVFHLDARVTVTVRNPSPPLVLGIESDPDEVVDDGGGGGGGGGG